jgi:hypothetical protein
MGIRDAVMRYRLRWHPRRGGWYFSLWIDGTLVLSGKRVCSESLLTWRYRITTQPEGHFMMIPFNANGGEPTRDGLGWTHALYWIDPTDMTTYDPVVLEVT